VNDSELAPDAGTARKDRILVVITALAAAVVYLVTLAPTVSFWDSGEYITCSWVAGIPHPPGVPLFVLTGRTSTIIFGFLPAIAQRVNLLCALSGVFSIALITRLVQRWGHRLRFSPAAYRPMAVLAGMLSAFSYSVWRNNNGTETYAVALLLSLLILWVFDLWIVRRLSGRPSGRQLLLVGYLITLSIANHLSALIVVGPIVLVYVHFALKGKTRAWRKPGFVLLFLGLMVLAFSIHLYMPLRAVQKPEINETNPCRWEAFRQALAREQYGQVSIFDRKGPFGEQLGLYMEYLSWQTGRPEAWDSLLGESGRRAGTMLWILLMAAVIYGLISLGVRRPDLLLLIGFTFLMASFAFVVYLNFKTGPEGTEAGEVRERDYFFGASFVFFSILASVGLVSALTETARNMRTKFLWLLLLLPAISLAVNYHRCDRSGDYVAHDYGINLLESCPDSAVLITNGDNDTFPLWFAQGVLGVRRDVIVSNLSLMNTPWYTHQLLDRDPLLLSYGEAGVVDSLRAIFIWGPNFFHVGNDAMPEWSGADNVILRSTFDQEWPWGVVRDSLAVIVPTMGRGSQGAVPMQDLLLFDMARNQPRHGREIYFAGTVALDNRVYFQDYLEMEGIAFRLMDHPEPDAVDAERGWELMDGYLLTGLDDPDVYKGDQARQLARNYISACHRLAYYHLGAGDTQGVFRALLKSDEIMMTMPEEWMQVRPQQGLIIARLVDGIDGPRAAMDTVLALADEVSDWASEHGDQRLRAAAMMLSQVSDEFAQEAVLREFADSMFDGTSASAWLRLEVDLGFGNFISAWETCHLMERDFPGDRFTELTREFMDETSGMMDVNNRLNLTTSAMYTIFSFSDPAVPDRFVWADSIPLESVLSAMVDHLYDRRPLPACAIGMLVSDRLDDREADLVGIAVQTTLDDPDMAEETAIWFLLESRRTSLEAVAWQCARSGRPDLCWLALKQSRSVPEAALDRLLQNPRSWTAAVPDPGHGHGDYEWVNRLAGE